TVDQEAKEISENISQDLSENSDSSDELGKDGMNQTSSGGQGSEASELDTEDVNQEFADESTARENTGDAPEQDFVESAESPAQESESVEKAQEGDSISFLKEVKDDQR
ncbi:MAG: hypothetical protein AAFQ34_16265, partial [Pseudomonadota bacterium]